MEQQDIKKWLDSLQRDSWQLELLISGFAIFGLIALNKYFETDIVRNYHYLYNEGLNIQFYLSVIVLIPIIVSHVLLFFLILHVIIRGMWIGAIGLRSVSGGVNFDRLNFSTPFKKKYADKVDYFDNYILRLEKIASILFSFAFLMAFIFLSIVLLLIYLITIIKLAISISEDDPLKEFIEGIIIIPNLVFVLLTVIDFIFLGYLKTIKWKPFAYFYYYINQYIGIITLSFLWRPLLFNFLDNKKTRYVLTVSTIFLLIFYAFIYNKKIYLSNYFPLKYSNYSNVQYGKRYYQDELEEGYKIGNFVITSKVIEKPYLELFVKAQHFDDYIELEDSTIITIHPKGIFNFKRSQSDKMFDDINKETERLQKKDPDKKNRKEYYEKLKLRKEDSARKIIEENYDKMLSIINKNIDVKLNNQKVTQKGLFYHHPNLGEQGLLYIIPIDTLTTGQHTLSVARENIVDLVDDLDEDDLDYKPISIPFYYVPSN